jgi:hypothetical protein
VSYSWKSTFIIGSQNVLHENQCTPWHVSLWTAASIKKFLEHLNRFLWIGEERERAVRTPDMEERVLDHVDRNAAVSTRQVGQGLNVSHTTIWRVPLQFTSVGYHACWFSRAREFCRCNVQRSAKHFFASSVLLTDEASFCTDGIINIYNQHQWAEENPRD